MKFFIKTSGETIVEVLVATVLLVSVLASAFVALNRAIRTNINMQDRIIAINLAQEGLESVRNIRDTNWLKYSGNRREKWLCLDSISNPDECSAGSYTTITNGFYQIDSDTSSERPFLVKISGATTLDIANTSSQLESFRLYIDASTKKFTYRSNGGANNLTPFYRQIELRVSNDPICGTGCRESKLEASVRVGWREKGTPKNIIFETHLFDFYQRNAY